ncbi:MAG: hypothetical protein JST63_18925 [Bacteroidetes bacterium]|nr:hypothetical protein [Bacteroidota bacterium]
MKWNKQLYEYEVNPPENVWDKIVHDLDNDHLLFKDRLNHAEISPPPELWDNIIHDLENDHLIFKTQLKNATILPPNTVWQNILEQIEPAKEKKVIIINIPTIFRIAAAASIIGILFFTSNYFFSKKAVEHETAVVKPKIPATTQQPVSPYIRKETQASSSGKKYIASASDINKKLKSTRFSNDAIESFSEHSFQLPTMAAVSPVPASVTDRYDVHEGFSRHVRNLKGEIREDVTLLDLPNSYFFMTGPDGQSIRVSSKFRNTIQYLNGSNTEELLDVILKESRYWKNRFRTWKEEVNNATFMPAPSNFMDIPELMRLLDQNIRN